MYLPEVDVKHKVYTDIAAGHLQCGIIISMGVANI